VGFRPDDVCEGFVVIQEAVATGLGVICTDECGAGDVFVQQDVNGFIVSTGSVDALAGAMRTFSEFEMSKRLLPSSFAETVIPFIQTKSQFVSEIRVTGNASVAALNLSTMQTDSVRKHARQGSLSKGNHRNRARSRYGTGIVAARVAEMILTDERAVIPIGSFHKTFGVTLLLPTAIGRVSLRTPK
jgi:glycosyl transferase family 1